MNELLYPIPGDELDRFRDYCLDWFGQRPSPEQFAKFKRIVRSEYKTWDSWDPLDYEAVKCLANPLADGMTKVALICYNHNETFFREQVMEWLSWAIYGPGIKDDDWDEHDHLFTRKGCYKRC